MAEVTVTTITDPKFGQCTQISNGIVEVKVATDFGPRILHCACVGKENMFFQDADKVPLGDKYDVFEDQHILYGGHRLWISPEIVPRCYHPDNKPATVTPVEGGARFTAAVEDHNKIQKSFTVTLEKDAPQIKVSHTIRNVGLWDITLAPWAITMLAPGGVEVMPMPNRPTGMLPNRNFTFWDYSELNDSRIYFGKDFITLSQDSSKENAFKLGFNNEAGWAAYFVNGQVFLKYFEPAMGGFYPDGGCDFETYTNSKMLEMETLGEIVELEPDEFVTLEEEWELYPAEQLTATRDEEAIKAAVSQWVEIG